MAKKHKKREWHIPQLSLGVKVVLVIVAIVVVAAVAMGIVMLVMNARDKTAHEPEATAGELQQRDLLVKEAQRSGAVRDDAQKAIDQGDTTRADEVYSQAIHDESDTTKKVQLAVDQSGVLYAAGKTKDAISVAKKAQTYSSDQYLVADWLSRLYEDQKQYTLAEQYYTLAGKWASSATNQTGLTKSYYDHQAARVAALAGKQ